DVSQLGMGCSPLASRILLDRCLLDRNTRGSWQVPMVVSRDVRGCVLLALGVELHRRRWRLSGPFVPGYLANRRSSEGRSPSLRWHRLESCELSRLSSGPIASGKST